jgi:DNA-binding NtrC family response regulator
MTILLAEGDDDLGAALDECLSRRGLEIVRAADEAEALRLFRGHAPALVIVGTLGGDGDPFHLSRQLRHCDRRVPILIVPGEGAGDLTLPAAQAGASECLRRPMTRAVLEEAVGRWLGASESGGPAARPGAEPDACERMVGASAVIRKLKARLLRVAASDCNVLITGETGTGKELAAELIHASSRRRSKPFVRVNCAAIPDGLVESELFGYEKGAFTGADSLREGMLKVARGGTVLLDEIGDMSPAGQAKMLRAVDTKEIRLLGARGTEPLDVRLIAATNRDLERLVAEGRFRQDLYFRLNVARVHVPSLKERKEDIPFLATHFLRELARRGAAEVEELTDPVLELLMSHDWPGNVRELRNALEAGLLEASDGRIVVASLPDALQALVPAIEGPQERERLVLALFASKWNKSMAAQKLCWSRMTLYRKMAKYQIRNVRVL